MVGEGGEGEVDGERGVGLGGEGRGMGHLSVALERGVAIRVAGWGTLAMDEVDVSLS